MSSNTFLIDSATRHQIFVQRYAGTQSAVLYEALDRIKATITKTLETQPNLSEYARNRLNAQLQLFNNYFIDATAEITDNMQEFAISEMAFAKETYDKAATVNFLVPSIAQAKVIVENIDIVPDPKKTLTIKQALSYYGKAVARDIRNTVNDGILLGRTIPQVSTDIAGLIDSKSKREATTVARTITSAVSAQAKNKVLEENNAFLEGEEWVATLDSRTTFECAGRDGRVYPVGKAPQIPAHYACRSTLVPVIKKEFRDDSIKGTRPSKGDVKEDVSSTTKFNGWLKKQSDAFQDEYLGPERAKLFRSGKLSVDKFRDETGKVYTLEQLKQLNPLAFD